MARWTVACWSGELSCATVPMSYPAVGPRVSPRDRCGITFVLLARLGRELVRWPSERERVYACMHTRMRGMYGMSAMSSSESGMYRCMRA